jgi:hypothetical protein
MRSASKCAPATWGAVVVAALAVGPAACATVRPQPFSGGLLTVYGPFSHAELGPVLRRFVDDHGQVDYAALRAAPAALNRYYYQVGRYSPDNHPELFPTQADRLAYWINAYNAAVLAAVLAHESIDSVLDVGPPFPLSFLPRESGFFVFERVVLGGRTTSLRSLEKRVWRRFEDPRVHFALSCASRSSPPLARRPFSARELDEQLDGATRAFVAEPRNVRIDHAERVVHLSSIFDWYRRDFLDWYAERYPGPEPSLVRYVELYAADAQVEALRRAATYAIRFVPYDWDLNASDASTPAETPDAEP